MSIGLGCRDLPWREREFLDCSVVVCGDDLDHPLLRELYGYWTNKRAGRPSPERADIDPTEIPRLLPHLILIDVRREPLDLVYRLVGTEVVSADGMELTGRRVRDLPIDEAERLFDAHAEVATDAVPRIVRGARRSRNGALRKYERLVLPLAGAAEVPNMLLCGSLALAPAMATGLVPRVPLRESYRPQF